MIKDITIGQYFAGSSIVHRLDPRTKMVLSMGLVVLLFLVQNPLGFAVCGVFILALYLVSGVPLKMLLKSLKPIIWIVLFTTLLNIFMVEGEPLLKFWIFTITREGVKISIQVTVRIILLISATSLLTYTTTPILLTDAIESLLSPLKKLRFPVHELAMMMTIALRFIPTLIDETDKIMSAQKSRGSDFESGSFVRRVKALIPILIPLFVSAFRRADELALAMESRCYNGGAGRTKMNKLRYSLKDLGAVFAVLLVLGAIIGLNFWQIVWL